VTRYVAIALALIGCAPTTSELRAPVDAIVATRLGGSAKVSARELLAKPLDRDAAIKVAIANNARLAAALDELGIAGGELGSALGLGPVEIHGAMRFGDHREYDLDVIQNLMGLIRAPRRRAAAHADIEAARATAAAATLRLAARVDMAFTDLLAAQAALANRRAQFDAADSAALLRERMFAAGNTTVLAQARDRDAREQARIAVARAETALELRRESLNAFLGLTGDDTKWTAAGELGALPARAPSIDSLEADAVAASLDLTAGRARRVAAENHAADVRLRTVLPELGVGVSIENDGESTGVGPLVAIAIPLFDWGSGDRARANAAIDRAEHLLAADAVELRATARAARITALAAYEEARHIADIVLPLRSQILDETLKHYNAMDADTFALLLARRELADAEDQQVEAVRRYWNAMSSVTALQRGVLINPPDPDDTAGARASAGASTGTSTGTSAGGSGEEHR
jgi:cobalt-zinc-cadmium efflux system outer membrane protein